MKANAIFYVCVLIAITGCGSTNQSGQQKTARAQSNPAIPQHPQRDRLIGEWLIDFNPLAKYSIVRQQNSEVHLSANSTRHGERIVNNVRFENDKLCFNEYTYHRDLDPLKTSLEHPFNGVCVKYILEVDDADLNKLKLTLLASGYIPEQYGTCSRVPTKPR